MLKNTKIYLIDLKKYKFVDILLKFLITTTFISWMLFGRAFSGLYFFGFRLGELIIGLGLFLSFFILFSPNQSEFFIDRKITLLHKTLILLFFPIALISSSELLNSYTYKSSTYIWTFCFIYLGGYIFGKDTNHILFKLIRFVLPIIYFFNTFIFPNFIFNFFKTFGDKFDYIKASDIILVFVIINFLNKKLIINDTKRFYSFIITLGFFAPLMSFMSRGSFLAILIYALIELFQQSKFIRSNFKNFILGCLLGFSAFTFSSVNVTSDMLHILDNFIDDITENYGFDIDININFNWLNFGAKEIDPFAPQEVTYEEIVENIDKGINRRNQNIFELFSLRSFSLQGGADGFRFYTDEPLANWRLQLWQDIIFDMDQKDILLTGYGYKEKIPAMELEDNNGNDSTNENVHNFFVQTFARGGLSHLVVIVGLNLSILIYWKKKYKNYKIIQFMFPLLLVASFDPALETVRYPFMYYTFLGYFLKTGIESESNIKGVLN